MDKDATALLLNYKSVVKEFKGSDALTLDERKAFYQKEKDAFKALYKALDKTIPFQLIKNGEVIATVRTMGIVTHPGAMLSYSEKTDAEYLFKGRSLLQADEVRRLTPPPTPPSTEAPEGERNE